MKQWPDAFQSCSQFTRSSYIVVIGYSFFFEVAREPVVEIKF